MPEKIIIFDLDGVITSETQYWNCAALSLYEFLGYKGYLNILPSFSLAENSYKVKYIVNRFLPYRVTLKFKENQVNNNWDIAYIVLLKFLQEIKRIEKIDEQEVIEILQGRKTNRKKIKFIVIKNVLQNIDKIFRDAAGLKILDKEIDNYVENNKYKKLYKRDGYVYNILKDIFQFWYYGTKNFYKRYNRRYIRKQEFCLIEEEVLLEKEDEIKFVLEYLKEKKYIIGILTGRPYPEASGPLKKAGILKYFDKKRIVTDEVIFKAMKRTGKKNLYKPNPFGILKIVYPAVDDKKLINKKLAGQVRKNIYMIGDSSSDIKASNIAKINCIQKLYKYNNKIDGADYYIRKLKELVKIL